MPNLLYDRARQSFLEGTIDWLTDTIKVVLVDADDYTVNGATHQYLSDIPPGARIAISPALAGKTSTAGVADATDVTLTGVSGDVFEAYAIFKDTGSAATSPLIAYIDTAIGLPIFPNGGNVVVIFDSGANRIFRL